jgi:hypothetical protein
LTVFFTSRRPKDPGVEVRVALRLAEMAVTWWMPWVCGAMVLLLTVRRVSNILAPGVYRSLILSAVVPSSFLMQRGALPVVLEFGFALVVILGAAVLFTNAVEILGGRLKLGQGAVGSVLAAVGTALPETMIPIVAILAAVFPARGERLRVRSGSGRSSARRSCSLRWRCS